jgi:uncharacterized protein
MTFGRNKISPSNRGGFAVEPCAVSFSLHHPAMTLIPSSRVFTGLAAAAVVIAACACQAGTRETGTYRRFKTALDAVPAIDTHEHLRPFDKLAYRVKTEGGRGTSMNLWSVWESSYYPWIHTLTPWKEGQPFDDWWAVAKNDFANARATGFYRSQLPAFRDLYGVDFERLTDKQARNLNDRILHNYEDPRWLYKVITERSNIELLFNDPFWARLGLTTNYPFEVMVFNVTTLLSGFHPSEYKSPSDDPYHFAQAEGLAVNSLDDYLGLLDRLFQKAKAAGAACVKSTVAYERTLDFQNVSRERAAKVFGRPGDQITAEERKDFGDFIMWRLVELSAKYNLPFQIHTGHARIQGSNPILLVNLIAANPKTKFILFHGGYPWLGETGAIVARYPRHVWVDSVWLPTISYTMAKRAFHEWLEVMPSDRIMWGGDSKLPEGIYAAAEFTRRCVAAVLAEKVDAGDLLEEQALRIGRQILRENALLLFPQLKDRLWKHRGRVEPPPREIPPSLR